MVNCVANPQPMAFIVTEQGERLVNPPKELLIPGHSDFPVDNNSPIILKRDMAGLTMVGANNPQPAYNMRTVPYVALERLVAHFRQKKGAKEIYYNYSDLLYVAGGLDFLKFTFKKPPNFLPSRKHFWWAMSQLYPELVEKDEIL